MKVIILCHFIFILMQFYAILCDFLLAKQPTCMTHELLGQLLGTGLAESRADLRAPLRFRGS